MAEYLDQFSKGFADLLPYEWIMIRHLERGIGRETSFARLGCAAKHHHSYRLIHACASRRCRGNDVSYRTNEPFPVVPQGAKIEFVFATEAGINARLFDTQLLRQHIHGCATVPVIPKHGQRAIQGDLLLNFSRHDCTRQALTSHRHRQPRAQEAGPWRSIPRLFLSIRDVHSENSASDVSLRDAKMIRRVPRYM